MRNVLVSTVFLLLLTIGLSGCGLRVNSKVSSFYVPEYLPIGAIMVVSANPKVMSSLEFKYQKSKLETKLTEAGYQVVMEPAKADFFAFVAGGIDEGRQSTRTVPIVGQTSGGTTSFSGSTYGTGGNTNFSGSTYTAPKYGFVGSATKTSTTYTRVIAMDIIYFTDKKEAVKVLEMRVKSEGSCGIFNEVFDEMLEAMFTNFPGENGKTQRVVLPMKNRC